MAAAGIRMGKVFVEIGADPSEFRRALSTINKSIGNLGKRMTMAGAGLTAAGTAITGALAGAAANFASVGDTIQKMSARTGASAKFLTEMGFAAEQSGTDLKTFGAALFRMTRRVANFSLGTGPAVRALTDLGFAADSFDGMSTEQKFQTIVDALNRIEDPALRAQYVFEIFGDEARALMPLLNAGAAGMAAMRAEAERLGITFDDEAAEKAAALADAMNRLKRVFDVIVFSVGAAVGPVFTEFYNTLAAAGPGISNFIKENGELVRSVLKGGVAITAIGGVLIGLGTTLQMISFSFAGLTGTVTGILSPFAKLGSALITAVGQFVLLSAQATAYATVSIASATATAAAWAVANAPLVLIGGTLIGIAAAVVTAAGGFSNLGNAIGSALGGVGGLVGNIGTEIGATFGTVLSDAKTVFSDLYSTASTTFGGISDALAAGDLASAAEIAWLGLQAVWLRGIQAIMSYTDPFIEALQNIWGDLSVGTINIFDGLFTSLQTTFNSAFAVIQGIVDNVVVGLLNTFDKLVTNIKIAWTRVQGFITGAEDTQERVDKIKSESEARQEARRQELPGIEGRQQQAAEKNQKLRDEAAARKEQREKDLANAKTDRANRTSQRAQQRQAQVDDVDQRLGNKRSEMADLKLASQLQSQLGSVTDADQLAQIGEQVAGLIDRGNLPVEREQALTEAYNAASSRVGKAQDAASQIDPASNQQAAQSSSEVAGTFSSVGIGGMGFGSSLVKEQLDTLKKIETNTREPATVQ
jgi:hypothetical protein